MAIPTFLGVEDYWRAVSDALDGAVPSEGSCLMTMDPATMPFDAKRMFFGGFKVIVDV